MLRVAFLVSGGGDNLFAHRATAFSQRLGAGIDCRLLLRSSNKLGSALQFLGALGRERPDVIYVMGMGYSAALAALLARLRWGIPYLLDYGDPVYQLLRSGGRVPAVAWQTYRLLEELTLRMAAAVAVRGSQLRPFVEARGLRRVVVLPDGVDTAQFRPLHVGDLRSTLGLSGRFTVGVLGSLAWSTRYRMCYGWDLVEALAYLRDSPVHGLVVGDGDGLPKLQRRAADLEVADQLTFFGRVPHADVPRYLSLMDVCLSTQSNDLVGEGRTTAKLPEYLACGCYVVATDVGEARALLPGVGSLLPYQGVRDDSYPARLAEHVRWLYHQPQELARAAKGIGVARQHLDYDVLAPRLRDLLLQVVEDQGGAPAKRAPSPTSAPRPCTRDREHSAQDPRIGT